ncbi:MAG TPA: hypothetical protein VKR06_27945 [Ktedonosporobacter sp.]|nr:hypothetical protein [Ktedonosporobacter sp.]
MVKKRQEYDSSLKSIFKEDVECIVPNILEDATYIEMLNIEAIPMPKRMDGAWWITHRGKKKPLNIEFQAGPEPKIVRRMLVYHAILGYDYDTEVVSLLVFAFRCDLPASLEREGITFPLIILGMWTLDGSKYVQEQAICMYTLLPTMGNVDAALLLQSIDEMVQYYQKNEAKLARCLLWFQTFLERTDTVTQQDKREVEERLNNFEQLLEESQWVQKHRAIWKKQDLAEGEKIGIAKGEKIGIDKGRVKEAQQIVLEALQESYPVLLPLARPQVLQIQDLTHLRRLAIQIMKAADEPTVLNLLHIPSA